MKKKYASALVLFLSLFLALFGVISAFAESLAILPAYLKASACDASVIALKSDGTVWTWGRNDVGQIGDGTEGIMDFRSTPTMVKGISDAVDVASGGGFNVVVKKDGSVWAWGMWGRAIEKGEYSLVPVKIDGFIDISAVAAGDDIIAALKKDGTVWMLETNPLLREYGSYDYDDEDYYDDEYSGSEYEMQMESKIPYQVKNLSRIKSISSFGNNMNGAFAAVRDDGTVWTWRGGNYEQIVKEKENVALTDAGMKASEDSYYIPAQVKGINDAVMAVPASEHMLVLKKDGTVWTWGVGMDITVGAGNMASGKLKYVSPTQIPGLTNVTFLAAAPDAIIMQSAIAVKSDGTVWRMHSYGGNGYVKVEPLTGVKSVAAGTGFVVFTKTDGTIWSCGINDYGQLGNGYNSFVKKPEKLNTIDNVKAFGTGANNSIALKRDGTVWHWGTFTEILESGANFRAKQQQYTKPTLIQDFTGVTEVSAGNNMITMVKSDGTAWAMGGNFIGELGNGSRTFSTKPVKVSLSGVKKVFNIKRDLYDYSIALMNDGTLRSWGDNQRGQLGDGTKTRRPAPAAVKGINNVAALALGSDSVLALKNDGTIWGWGSNLDGTLGKGVKDESLIPVRVNNLTDVTAVAMGGGSAAALKKDGTVWAWGYNGIGQLGQNSETVSYNPEPVKIPGLTNVKAIASGYGHMLALKQDGTVWAWGDMDFGSFDGLEYDKAHLVRQIPELSGIIEIAAGDSHSMALKNDGTLWVWGLNKGGQLGNGGADMFYPVQVIR